MTHNPPCQLAPTRVMREACGTRTSFEPRRRIRLPYREQRLLNVGGNGSIAYRHDAQGATDIERAEGNFTDLTPLLQQKIADQEATNAKGSAQPNSAVKKGQNRLKGL